METKSFKGEFKAAADGEPRHVRGRRQRVRQRRQLRRPDGQGRVRAHPRREGDAPGRVVARVGDPADRFRRIGDRDRRGPAHQGPPVRRPDEDHAVARQVYTAMKAGALKEFSFGYATKASNDVTEDGETSARSPTSTSSRSAPPSSARTARPASSASRRSSAPSPRDRHRRQGRPGALEGNETKLRDARPHRRGRRRRRGGPKNLSGETPPRRRTARRQGRQGTPKPPGDEESATRIDRGAPGTTQHHIQED
jgi:hypothetical protein